ncbi:MAG TPA: phosphodiester glycosidase family protein [Verrucomicrobiae bacterium]|nr:phosphodiester glycosidase family protein [Verrucomicrobiae bacterium]
MHIAIIDLTAPGVRFKLTPPGGARETARQTTLDFLNQEQAQLAINAHFYLPYPPVDLDANLVGLAASEGVVYSWFEPQPVAPDYIDQSYAILPYAPALNIDRSNKAAIVHFDPIRSENQHVVENVALWNAVSGSAQIVSNGAKAIPTYSGPPGGLNPLAGYYSATNSWYAAVHARTAIGLTADRNTLILFTVDEAGGSLGMTPGEVADLLIQDYGVSDALNLDGDGSTSMAMEDPISQSGRLLTASSDNPLGRAVGSNLAVFAEPTPERVVPLNIILITNGIVLTWPKIASNWTLERAPDTTPGHWSNVAIQAESFPDRLQVVLPRSDRCTFYRLAQNLSPTRDR